jgi:leucyl-tRNA---protein transferase
MGLDLYFATELAPCPYLEGRLERRLVTALVGTEADARHARLMASGFRRSQRFAYRPVCPGCSACVPVRIPVARFVMRRAWRRILRANADLEVAVRPAVATTEQFALFQRYLASRHGDGGMSVMSFADYQAMVGETSVGTLLIEWRCPGGRLMAASLTDRAPDALSGVYKFFEPEAPRRSLGTLIILWHVEHAARLGLAHVYLGYWIAESPKMAYKARFQPLERLGPAGWEPLVPDPPPLAAAAPELGRERLSGATPGPSMAPREAGRARKA